MEEYPEYKEFGGIVGTKCTRPFKRGWHCIRYKHHGGPCALKTKWWNIRDRFRYGL